jgi:hypothetical protein
MTSGERLEYDLIGAAKSGEIRNPQEVLRSLGIVPKRVISMAVCDILILECCRNIPDELPAFIKRRHVND